MKSRFSWAMRTTASIVATVFSLTFLLDSGSLAIASSSATSSGNFTGQLGQIAESASPTQSFQTDLFTGRAQTSVPIFVPPGRKNVQPSLNLGYSSSSGNGWLGMGWSLELGSIQRDTKNGIPKYDSSDKFIFSFQGVASDLISVATNEYRAKDEALFLKFVHDTTNNKWIVTDKSGTQHTFGDGSSSRQSNGLGTFKWLLCKVKDTVGNYMTVSYTTDNGQVYLSSIEYNGNETQSFAHSHKVEFTLEDRDDDTFSYATGAKVSTIKRLDNIQVKVKNGGGTYTLARKYVMDYEYSTSTSRSRLISVTEYGTDGSTGLPATTFVYQDKVAELEDMADADGIDRLTGNDNYDFIRTVSSSGETVADFVDVNGDAINDRVQAASGIINWNVQHGNGTGFAALSTFGTPYKPSSAAGYEYTSWTNSNKEQVTDFTDINADGFSDRIIAQDNNTSWIVQLNNGSNAFEASNSSWSTISRMVSSTNYDYIRYTPFVAFVGSKTLVDFFDINGDGLPDRVMAEEGTDYWKVQLNTGSGFSSMQNWGDTERRINVAQSDAIRFTSHTGETNVDVADLNGDGLPDRIQSDTSSTVWKVQWNTGSGFTSMEDYGPIEIRSVNTIQRSIRTSDPSIQDTDFFDVNGDGLPDRVLSEDASSIWKVQYNTGSGFTSKQNFDGVENMSTPSSTYSYPRWSALSGKQHVDVADFNADGLPDRLQSLSGNTAWKLQINKGPFPDLLKEIKNGRGAKTAISYSPAAQFDNRDTNGKHRLPFPMHVVTQAQQSDGMGNTVTTTYSYKGGMYDAADREFRGFREVTVTDAVGTKTIQIFDQSSTKKGRLLEKVVRDASGNLFSKEVTTWGVTNPYTGVNFASVSEVSNYLYDGDQSYKRTRQAFTYDSYGNLASSTEYGEYYDGTDTGHSDVTTDSRKTANTYVYNTTDYILNTLSKTTLYDTDLTTIKSERYFYYDGATSITDSPTAGLLTKEEEWLNTASGCSSAGTCTNNPKTTMTYDDYGNVETVTDARSYTTTNTYDSTYHLFLIEIENALSHTREFTYDPWLAQILTSTDQNGEVTETIYDVLGRVTKVIAPLDSSGEPTQEFAYDYPNLGSCGSTCVTRTTTKVKSSVPGDTFAQLITYSFADGLGREIQRRSPSEGSDQIVSGIVTFNSRGLVDKQYVPYFATSSTSYVTPDNTKPKATFTYDAVGRRTRIDYPDSTNSQVTFSDFVKTTTDQRGKQLRYTNDAYGRLVQTEEFNAGSTYTTTYEYDVLNNLKKTTDNQTNETTITYDSLSRKIGMDDPDMGVWSYEYDLNDNLVKQLDAKNQGGGSGAITHDATTSLAGSGTTDTQSHTVASDANGMIAMVAFWDCGGGTVSVSSMTFNGDALTLANRDTVDGGSCGEHVEIWYMASPDVGTYNLVTNFSGSTGGMDGVVVSLKGFKATSQPNATADGDHLWCSDPDSDSITVSGANSWVFDIATAPGTFGSPSGGQTQLGSSIASYKSNVASGSTSMGWGYTGCHASPHALASFSPSPANPGITFTYDALNRVTLKDLPSGETDVTYAYDTAPTSYSGQTGYWVGRLAKVTDNSGTHEFIYDKQGRTLKDKKTVSGTGYEFIKTYDSLGRVRTLTYPDTEVVTYAYNGYGDVETIQGLKSGVTTDYVKDVNYNASGQTTYLKYGNNVTSDYTFSSTTQRLSNILTKKPDGTTKLQDLTYAFDNSGNVSSITDAVNSMSQTFTYDDLSRLTQAVGSAYGTQNFAYDSIGNMTSKAGRTLTYGTGARPHAVTGVQWTGSNYPTFCRDFASGACGMVYDANGNMTTRGQDSLSYDSENRLTSMAVREGTSGTQNTTLKAGWNVISFTYLPNDKSVSNVMSGLTFGTAYNQVSTWDAASGTWKHWVNDSQFNDFTEFQYGKTYEIYNNSGSDKTLSVTGITNGNDLTHNIVSGDNFISPAVKTATNVTTVLAGLTQGTHYSDVKRFNATSQTWESYAGSAFTQFEPGKGYNIIGLTNASFSYGKTETTTTFVYDSTGERVKKTVGGTTTTYLGKDYDITGSTSTKYIFLGDRRISTKDSGGTLQFIHDDHISSSNVITDSSGNQAGLFEYDPYGSTVTHTGSADPKHKFTGQEEDASSHLYYMGARFYDPQLGRMISPDRHVQNLKDPQFFNRYAYARNNPVIFIDPTGNFAIFAAIFAFFVAHATELAIISIVATVGSYFAARAGNMDLAKGLNIAGLATGIASLAGGIGSVFNGGGGPAFVKQVSVTSYKPVTVALGDGMRGITYVKHTFTVTIINTNVVNVNPLVAGAAMVTALTNAIDPHSLGSGVHLSDSGQASEPKTQEEKLQGAARNQPVAPNSGDTEEWHYGQENDPRFKPDGEVEPDERGIHTTPNGNLPSGQTAQDALDTPKVPEGRRKINIPRSYPVQRGTVPGGEYGGKGGEPETLVKGKLPKGSAGPFERFK